MTVRIGAAAMSIGLLLGSALIMGLLGLVFWLGILPLLAATAGRTWFTTTRRRMVRRLRPVERRFKDDQDYLDWTQSRGRWAQAGLSSHRFRALPE